MRILSLILGILTVWLIVYRASRLCATGHLELNGHNTSWRSNKSAFLLAVGVHLVILGFGVRGIWLFFSPNR